MSYSNLVTSNNIIAAKLVKVDTGMTDKTKESSGYIIMHGHDGLMNSRKYHSWGVAFSNFSRAPKVLLTALSTSLESLCNYFLKNNT